jgi:signal transduction histidine kinase
VLRYEPRALDVEVRDDGRGAAPANGDGSGHGLIGMRERVALYGGALQTGPREGGGFEIRAHLPLA